ncbi:MAG: hypothetical protein WDZ26_03725 [Nitriliruptoraceae bacterium]
MAGPGRSGSFERRSARSRTVVIVMVVLMALSLIAVPLTQLFASL